jgi:hypothetical protein
MILARLRRFAWLLILVLVTGLSMPVLASGAPCDMPPAAVTHTNADGAVRSHAARAGHDGAGAAADRSSGKSSHCPGCMTDAACAGSCLGLAVLPVTGEWATSTSAASWNLAAPHARAGVTPAGDIDPPRVILPS